MIRLTSANSDDALELQLRAEDAAEVSEGWRDHLAKTILTDGAVSFRDHDGHLIALFGVSVTDMTVGPWLLCSERVKRHRATLWRRARRMVDTLRNHAGGRLIYNYIPKGSHANRRFVMSLGFVILPSPRDGFDLFFLPHV